MSSPTPQPARPPTPDRRPSLRATLMRVAAVSAVAAVLVWSALFLQLVRERGSVATTTPQIATGQTADPNGGQPAQEPAPVTTRTS